MWIKTLTNEAVNLDAAMAIGISSPQAIQADQSHAVLATLKSGDTVQVGTFPDRPSAEAFIADLPLQWGHTLPLVHPAPGVVDADKLWISHLENSLVAILVRLSQDCRNDDARISEAICDLDRVHDEIVDRARKAPEAEKS